MSTKTQISLLFQPHGFREGFRADGRRVHEPRGIQCCVGGGRGEADGYAVFELGSTKAVAYVYGPMEARQRSATFHDRALLTCVLSTAALSGPARGFGRRGDRQSQERSMWMQQAFESAILLEQYPRSQIRLYVQILQAEGSSMAAAINAALWTEAADARDALLQCLLTVGRAVPCLLH
ncbi:Exosc4 [Symbiodinium pilosum]|uniref:Exosc4 protein n=1 Tax=Symbiodinium pilosum TaxID=2952 RepID=A0A812WKD0_SYMPI|nr:Exosc4 [Symbiodinium pilosum]